jgi:RimJ/RimL family protein N-acetyltransferase
MTTHVLETERLRLRELAAADGPFILELLNDPDFIRYVADRRVRTEEQARAYIANGPAASYAANGFGLWRVALKTGDTPIGVCGLIRREGLDDVDVGFAFLPPYRAKGYAYEAARAALAHGREALGLKRIVAIVSPDNERSIRLLEKLGMRFERMVTLPGDDEEIRLYALA